MTVVVTYFGIPSLTDYFAVVAPTQKPITGCIQSHVIIEFVQFGIPHAFKTKTMTVHDPSLEIISKLAGDLVFGFVVVVVMSDQDL